MIENSMESDELNNNNNNDEISNKKKIKLIIITKNGKSEKKKEKSKITLQNEKGRFEIRMENMTQTLNKNKIDKALKSFIKNISDSSFDKNKEKTYTSVDNNRKQKKKILINNDDSNEYYDIYLEKKKKLMKKNNNKQKNNEEITGENILFKKLKLIEKEKETNLINTNNENINNNNEEKNNAVVNDDLKESNRHLFKKDNIKDESMNNKLSSKIEIESINGAKNDIINSNLNINNFFKEEKKEKMVNLKKNRETEEHKNDINIYHVKDNINNNNLNNLNNISRNVGRQLLKPQQNSDMYDQSTNNFNKIEQNISNSNYKIRIDNNLNIQIKHNIQRNLCSICEITYTTYTFFVAECNKHFLCKKCAKSFYEEKIETGAKELFCPFIFCNKRFSNNEAKKFLSKRHYNILVEEEKNNNINSIKLINHNNYKEMKNYSENHVLDINNNKIFYNFNKNKNVFCSRCNNETLFCRDKQLFMRCLYCRFAQCKYCFKEYTHDHFDMNSKNYCRIYYRDSEFDRSQTKINRYFIQLFLVFAIFFLSIISLWKVPKKIFTNFFFKLNDINNNNNCFLFYLKLIFIYVFTLIIFIICLPINIVMYPWFPSFLALFEY